MADEKQTPALESQVAAPSTDNTSGVKDKRARPEGVVPKQAQGYVMAGLAVLILMAVMFSKNHAKPVPKDTASSPLAVSTDANQRKIQELEQDLSADQRQSQQQARTASTAAPATTPSSINPATGQPVGTAAPAMQLPPPAEPPRDTVADAEKALAFKSRFASNLVSADGDASHPSAEPVSLSESAAARSSSLPPTAPTQAAAAPAAAASATASKRAPEINLNAAHGLPYALFEGTTIDTVLVDRLDGEFVGDVKVMVTNPVYSEDRQHVLIPEGTFILGTAQKVGSLGQKRLALTFHRMLMPDKYSVDLDAFHGLDQAGESGVKDKVNNHYMEIFGASIALGVISGAAEATSFNQGYNETGSEAYRQGIASSLSQSGATVLDRFINIPPTITIRNGHRIKIYITQDMLLPAYENHDMSSVM
ncbi:type IV secretion system protein VirB10 [Silvibacterium bohemicum]|uniref:Type IV secretion system protein VirB10 n=1 Tax=Silvibacterium bohemicum TaxID=1577686 RepID=A0A841K2S9_9BACT|nr:TrbI/VirB10 family protein [Silvibacterium bohemicum]MBB6147325.1 type IV secretion system protein VirB10 [Silvibacterium bohemicum]